MCMHYMVRCDDGVLAGNRKPVLRAIHLTEELGTALGLHINLTKCELFSSKGNTSFPPAAKISLLPNLDILGTSGGGGGGTTCTALSLLLISMLSPVNCSLVWWMWQILTSIQIAVTLLRMCGSFCNMIHLARITPPSLASDALVSFDVKVRQCFTLSSASMFLILPGDKA